jgi:hypothetical protein
MTELPLSQWYIREIRFDIVTLGMKRAAGFLNTLESFS